MPLYNFEGKEHHGTMLPRFVSRFYKKNMVMAEVGVWDGNSLKLYINIIKQLNGKLYLIDWWKGETALEKGSPMEYRSEGYEKEYQKVLDIVEENDAKDNVVILRGDSVEMSKQIQDEELDLCFIDAGHSFEECKRDIIAYLPKVKNGGILCGDDFDSAHSFYNYLSLVDTYTEEEISKDNVEGKGHPGVLQAVWETLGDNVLYSDDAWYHFKGYRPIRGVVGLAPEAWNSGTQDSISAGNIFRIKGGIMLESEGHSPLIEPASPLE